MFKLESYLTPLLLNYVDKYIKNLKPEDSQFSLWGGDAVFCNLDLRLDVLEEELQLPFTFVNGHIHELRIHIPWTKLGSEPVVITINTIECILKLSVDSDASDYDTQNPHRSKKISSYKIVKKTDDLEAPPGYVQSLINRVISNISIICNNIILKYVEDDIVLSLNIKSMELFNVNNKWEKAFVDTSLADTVFRKVIHMHDLTVCLDKRDASGKIETYQDPLLYRCSSTWRLYSVFNSPHSKYPVVTRIHMFCESLDFSLTDQQLPMFLRLLYLCIALQNRNISDGESGFNKEGISENTSSDSELGDDTGRNFGDESWGSWAWSFVPDVSPIWGITESEEEQEKESNWIKAKRILQFGLYIGKSSCVLKRTVLSQDTPSCCGSPKCVFLPLMVLHLYGCSMEFTSRGKDFVNVQTGVSGATITGLEDCVCGFPDFSSPQYEMKKIFFKSGVPPGSGHAYSFLSSSLFDPLAPENCNQSRKYCFDREEHLAILTEEVLVERFPAFAFDYLYEVEVPDEFIDRLSTVTTTFLEESNWHESSTCRLVFGPLCLDITSSLIHRLSKLVFSAKDCEYPNYYQPRKISTKPVNITDDDIKQLEEFVSVRQYHLTLFKPVLRISVADHLAYSPTAKPEVKKKKKSLKYSKLLKVAKALDMLSCIEIYADCVDLQATSPMYPNRLVKILNSLSHPSHLLLHHCFDSNSIKLFGLEVSLQKESEKVFSLPNIINNTSLTLFSRSLVCPDNWTCQKDLPLKESSVECGNLSMQLSETQFIEVIRIYQSWTANCFNPAGLEKLKIAKELSNSLPQIFVKLHDIKSSFLQHSDISFVKAAVSSVCVKFHNGDHTSILFNAPEMTTDVHKGLYFDEWEGGGNKYEELKNSTFLQLLLQLPKLGCCERPTFILYISGSTICLEPAIISWLSSAAFTEFNLNANVDQESFSPSSPVDLDVDESTCSSVTQEASASHSFSKSHSTNTGVVRESGFQKNLENILVDHSEFLSHLLLEVEIESLCGLLPRSSWSVNYVQNSPVLQSWHNAALDGHLNGACVFSFPKIKMKNNGSANNFLQNFHVMEMNLPLKYVQADKKSQGFPWALQIDNFSIYTIANMKSSNDVFYLLMPTTSSATIALSSKSNQNQLGLCVHMDSKCVCLNISAFQAELLVDCLQTISTCINFVERIKLRISCFNVKTPDILERGSEAPEVVHPDTKCAPKNLYENANICNKAFSNENRSSDSVECSPPKKLTLWTQLTLSKMSIILLSKLDNAADFENFKVEIDVEEIISSLDIQEIYSKIIVKLSSLSINCFLRKLERSDWQSGPYKGVILFGNNMVSKNIKSAVNTTSVSLGQHMKSDNHPFLVSTYTRALCSNVKEKWNVKQHAKAHTSGLQFISEIDIKVKSFDIILWVSLFDVMHQIFYPFWKSFGTSSYSSTNVINENKSPIGIKFSSQNLPLLYIETNIIQLYLPENNILYDSIAISSSLNQECPKNEKEAEVLLLQLDCVSLTSQVENPLPRIILNPGIYSEALNSKTIALPGAAVEDRQYQMDIFGLALGSLPGSNMSCQTSAKREQFLHHPLTMGENPALEWNIGVIPENRNFANESNVITPVISPLNIRIAVAPAIIYEDQNKSQSQEKIAVAGISVEVSVTSDISLYLSIEKTCFIYSLLKSNLNFFYGTLSHFNQKKSTNNSKITLEDEVSGSQTSDEFQIYIPSCFTHDSSNNIPPSTKSEKSLKYNFVPFDILITAGSVSIMLFYHEETLNSSGHEISAKELRTETVVSKVFSDKSSKVKSHLETDQVKHKMPFSVDKNSNKSATSSEYYHFTVLHPFACVSIVQPHTYILCHPSSQKFESSCFDLRLYGSPSGHTVKKLHKSCTPVNDDFIFPYLETKPGEPNEKTGIPPAFFTVTCTDFFNDPANIKISIERPVKFNFRNDLLGSILAFIKCCQEEFSSVNIPYKFSVNCNEQSVYMDSNFQFPVKLKILKFFEKIVLYTTQLVFEFMPSLDAVSEKLIISAGRVVINTEVETHKDELKSTELNVKVSSIILQSHSVKETWNFLQPLSFSLTVKCHFNPWFQIEFCIVGESLLLNLSLHHILKLKEIIKAIEEELLTQINSIRMMVSVVDKTLSCSAQHADGNETKKRKHWVDDLRKGAFQFIQVSEDKDFQPKAHEIVFNRASPNQPASMTWRYPEPRALTKIHVSPVPFQCEEGKLSKDTQVLTCYLQFWNSAHHEYMNLCDFMLSETEQCSLDLPDLNSDFLAVSDKWRVLLDCRSYIDDDGVLEKETPCLSPLALAACMAIDSCFDPCLIPVLQIRASFELAKLTLYNYFQKTGYSPTLFPFEFDDESPSNQEFAVLSFINPTLSYIKWSSKLKGELSSGVTCEIVEYRNLTMLPVISPVDIHCNSSVNFDKEKVPLIDMECIIQPCFVRLTQSIVHTISYTVHSFYQEFLSSPFFCSEYILPNYYLICNRLHESIRFGQTNTEEYVILSPLKVHAYSWWCHKSKQMLRLSIGSLHWKWSSDFSIDVEGIQRVVLDNNITVIIRIKQLSNHQKQVIVDGQLTFHSELNFPVQLRCKFHVPTSQKGLASSLQFIKSLSPCSSSPAFLLSPEQCKNMTLSVTGILDTQLWSEEFFLDEKMLIKIPFENKNVFQNAWCQVARQSIEENITVIVVFFSPLFVIRSNLPIPLNVEIISQEGNKYDVHLIGRGQEIQLLDGSETGHELQFKFKRHASSDTDISAPPLSVSASYLSKMPIKMFEGHENLYEICCQMQSFNNMMWPYSFYERSCHPTTILESLYPCSEEYSNLILATGCVNICSKLKVECSQRWEGLNTILIDVKPYILLINRLNTDLYLFDKNGFQWLLSQNSVAMPSFSEESFQLSIMEHEKYFYSCNLTLEESVSQKNASTNLLPTSFGNKEFQSIPCNGSLNILIPVCLEERKVFMFTLKSEVREGMIVITAFPLISIMNKTQDELFLSLHCIQNSAGKVNFHETCRNPIVLGSLTECCYPLVWWEDITSSSSPFPELVEINFYISLAKSLDLEWSYPVCFDSKLKDHSRHAVAVPVKYGANSCMSVPYVLTSHLHNGLLFLVVNQDPNPLLLLHNRTNMDIFYGESCSEVEGITVYEELQKHKIIPVLHPEGSCHYAFPSLEAKFPQVLQKLPMLCLGSRKKSSEKCTWSMPFKINIDKQFVHILGICDIMVHSEQLGHTLNLYIESVNRIELTAKEVRSRIALATDFNNHASSFVKETECAKSKTSSNKKDCEIKARSKLQSAGKKSVMWESTEHFSKFPYIFYINLRVIHTSFIICDEFKEINKSMEVLRLNIDNAVFYSRPHNGDSLCRLQEISLCFEHIQLDNQIDQESNIVYDFPVVLQRHSESDVKSGRIHHDDIFLPNKVRENSVFILSATIEFPNNVSNSIVYRSLNIELLPVSLYIEDTFCYKVIALSKTYKPVSFHQHKLQKVRGYFPKNLLFVSALFVQPVHFQHMTVSIKEIYLSLHASLKIYLSLEHSLLRFQPFEVTDLFTTPYEAGRVFILHYLTGALFRAGWVVGSLDLLGNPAGFARAVGIGMSDFVYLPYRGLFHGPRAFIYGLSSGAASLFKQISSGAIICMASLASSVSKNMDFFCMDDEHLARQELLRRHLPQGISDGFIQGLSGFGLSLLGAVAGIVDHPLQVIISPSTPMQTASGIVGGLGKGIIGMFTKPIGGAAELLSQTGYGILHGAGWLNPPKRQYQPVTMSFEMVMSSYMKYLCKVSQCSSLGEVLLSVEATYVNENGEYEKSILLLTSEALCILTEDEVSLQCTFALTEIKCKKSESDLSTLVIIPSNLCKKQLFLDSCDAVDRVAEYVKRNRLDSSEAIENLPESTSDPLINSSSSCHVFFLYPRDRSLFLTLFSYAKNKAMGKGFCTDY